MRAGCLPRLIEAGPERCPLRLVRAQPFSSFLMPRLYSPPTPLLTPPCPPIPNLPSILHTTLFYIPPPPSPSLLPFHPFFHFSLLSITFPFLRPTLNLFAYHPPPPHLSPHLLLLLFLPPPTFLSTHSTLPSLSLSQEYPPETAAGGIGTQTHARPTRLARLGTRCVISHAPGRAGGSKTTDP